MALQATCIMALAATTSLFLFFPFSFAATNATVLPVARSTIPIGGEKVNVNFYYEALCRSCRDFITGNLEQLLRREFGSAVNLRLIPWGNARIANGNFVCQFGPDECYLNTVQACAINRWPDLRTHLNFIQCSENAYKDWTSCVTRETAQELQQCATSNIGKNLELALAYETLNLYPPREFVPWVTVNNLPLRKDIFDITKYICDAYKGPDPPAVCCPGARINDVQGQEKFELQPCNKG